MNLLPIKDRIKKSVCDVIDIEDAEYSDSLTDDLGYDSIDFLQLISAISSEFEIKVSPQDIKTFTDELSADIEKIVNSNDTIVIESLEKKYNIIIAPDFINTLITFKELKDIDAINARIFSLLTIDAIALFITKHTTCEYTTC